MEDQRTEDIQALRRRLAALDRDLQAVRARASRHLADSGIRGHLEAMIHKRDHAANKIEKLRLLASERWGRARMECERALLELSDALSSAEHRMRRVPLSESGPPTGSERPVPRPRSR